MIKLKRKGYYFTMKPAMTFALVLMTAIILMSSFGVHLGENVMIPVPENLLGSVLFICPAASSGWDSASSILQQFIRPLLIIVFFAFIMLMFVWGWALYQNLLKDKFDKSKFTNPWGFTKMFFWACIILLLAVQTPNHFKIVHVRGLDGNYVLCEQNTPNSWPDVLDGKWPKGIKDYSRITR